MAILIVRWANGMGRAHTVSRIRCALPMTALATTTRNSCLALWISSRRPEDIFREEIEKRPQAQRNASAGAKIAQIGNSSTW